MIYNKWKILNLILNKTNNKQNSKNNKNKNNNSNMNRTIKIINNHKGHIKEQKVILIIIKWTSKK